MINSSKIAIESADEAFIARVISALNPLNVTQRIETLSPVDVVIVDSRRQDLMRTIETVKNITKRVVVFTDHEDTANINMFLDRANVFHLVGSNGCDAIGELKTIITKMQATDVFGLNFYFGSQTRIDRDWIDDADKIKPKIDVLLSHLDLNETFASAHEFLTLTFNELVTNAIYNAPVDQFGQARYEQTDRRVKVKLEPHEKVEMAVCENQACIGILVQDQFGRLSREKIVRHLVKCVNNTSFIDDKKGGAGAGIYLAFHTASQLVVNIDPGRRLEVICIVEKNKRYKDYRARVTSFNYFVKPKSSGSDEDEC